ncbi:phosphoserine phosphatase SerB [Pseudoalteromonas sp. P94(2023)]|uniref:Phosphoserine phosphatase n=2 Tax=Pseudoalteromonas TaxID=53246 RepID=A0ABT7EKV8_9GAMM|nr:MULTISPECIES: phosphoserine phosphatase SerB [Pseudoalteromonas]MDK2595678.1 phosphoserine phosphatase SerB [Pseudoalteromonas sp. P94(2023)]
MPMQNIIDVDQFDVRPVENQLTLSKWYEFGNAQSAKVGVSTEAKSQYIVLFGASVKGTSLTQFIEMLSSEHLTFIGLCAFKAHDDLPVGVAIEVHLQQVDALPKAIVRQAAQTVGCQGAILPRLPQLLKPGLLVMDMDSTAIEIECIDEIARLADVYDEVASVTAEAMAGKLAFSDSLYKRVAKLKGIELSLISPLKEDLPLMAGIKALCEILKSHDWRLAIASGGFTWFAEALQVRLGLDHVFANTLEIEEQKLTGRVIGEVVDADKKAQVLESLRSRYDISAGQTLAIGDGANDLVMMAAADLGVAVHGKPKVVERADAAICDGSLLQLLYFLTVPMPDGIKS